MRALDSFREYFWIIFKNVIGWILILATPVLGAVFPGPGGTFTFILGFALVTFPGKRKLTSRVMRGRGLPIDMHVFTFLTALLAIVVTCILMWLLSDYVYNLLETVNQDWDPRREKQTYGAIGAALMVTGLFALAATWIITRLGLQIVNYVLKGMPYLRRKVKPWMRKRGLILLPSRRAIPDSVTGSMENEILQIDERHHHRLRAFMAAVLPWARRVLAVVLTIATLYWVYRPIHEQWPLVKQRLWDISIIHFIIGAGMFAMFLFAFRALVWRLIVASFGHNLPIAPAVRIWSTSELARYVPGVIWQVVGRIYLVRPYGVTASVCTITQVLELSIFLLANILVALSCLFYYGITNLDGAARAWTWVAILLLPLPVLVVLLHPKIFYGIVNFVMSVMKKPPIVQRVKGSVLFFLLIWNILGLLWQSLAVFIVVMQPLELDWSWWWVIAGAYCLAWCAGFTAFWAPGGIGVREIVFILAMKLFMPDSVQESFITTETGQTFPRSLLAMLALLSVLLRLWATAGEIILATIAYALDFRGAMGKADAPGRLVQFTPEV